MNDHDAPPPARSKRKKGKVPPRPKTADSPLSWLEQRFAEEYPIDHNGTQAAIRAGYKPAGAGVQAHVLLKRPNVKAAVRRVEQATLARVKLTREGVLKALAALVNEPVPTFRGLTDQQGNLRPLADLTNAEIAMIQSVEVVKRNLRTGGTLKTGQIPLDDVVKVKLWNTRSTRVKAVELALRHFGELDKDAGDDIPDVPAFALPADSVQGPAVLPASRRKPDPEPSVH